MINFNPIAKITQSRQETLDDYWGDAKAIIELDSAQFDPSAIAGLDTFSHIEVIFYFHLVNPNDIVKGSSHPRGNKEWPKCGIFAQRKKDRPNQIGVSICKLEKIEGHRIYVSGLDAVEGTPVLDIKPVIRGFVPNKEEIKEPEWATSLMCAYYKNESERK